MSLWRRALREHKCEKQVTLKVAGRPRRACKRNASYVVNGRCYCYLHAPEFDRKRDTLMECEP